MIEKQKRALILGIKALIFCREEAGSPYFTEFLRRWQEYCGTKKPPFWVLLIWLRGWDLLPDVRYSRLAQHLRLRNSPYLSSLNRLAPPATGGARRFRPTPSVAFGDRRSEWFKSNHTQKTKKDIQMDVFSFLVAGVGFLALPKI